MNKPINDLKFWKDRIDKAERPYFSVYRTSEGHWKEIWEEHKKIISNNIKPDEFVLDAGCGYGRMSELFSKENYVGTDFSPDFILKAKELYPDKEFKQADLKALPFEDGYFDWAICVSIKRMVIDNLGEDEWNLMLKELKRVSNKVLVLEYEDPKPFEIL